jgi:hypothetical protein
MVKTVKLGKRALMAWRVQMQVQVRTARMDKLAARVPQLISTVQPVQPRS